MNSVIHPQEERRRLIALGQEQVAARQGDADPKLVEGIFNLEFLMKHGNATGQLQPTVCPVKHFFAPGVYVRYMLIPAGVATIGHIHRDPCVTIIASGSVMITSPQGGKQYGAGDTLESPAGAKRAVFALSDTVLITVHGNPTNERDTDKVFENLIVDIYADLSGEPTAELKEQP